ncbi:serine/threonine protein kinase [Corallococcus carmarthensis]|uniref:serine/threonine protein kinase n=1 Tax=Corallococcus carmarthensis TaxID=2316728 RepID=UPI00148DDD93|nr:serine/threonine-protein kinase [Corallococcus carmarthensis]NOK18818.1 serine/threonine protein kinase [Corallococcus carmarthensis]
MKISLPTRDDKGKSGRKARPNTPVDSLLGTQLGEFTIEECIGEGGMGVVYRAVHPLIGKQVAIKVLRSELDSEHLVHRLLMEARAVNSIKHPGIVDIFGFGNLPDERPYVTMELLQGRPLSDFVRANRPMELESVVWVMDQALSALGAAHRAGVIHRDLKPANIFIVTGPTTPPAVKLVDFGIAKLLESRENPMTSEGTVLGTPEFMAPEQIRGARIGPTTDLYAMGVILFQMLTGSRPFQGDPVQVMFAHMERSPPVPSSRASGIPPALDALVLHLLEKNPTARPPSSEAVRDRLKSIPLSTAPHVPSIPTEAPDTEEAPTLEDTFTAEALNALKGGWEIAASPEWWVAPVLLVLCLGGAVLRLQPSEKEFEALEDQRVAQLTSPDSSSKSQRSSIEAIPPASREHELAWRMLRQHSRMRQASSMATPEPSSRLKPEPPSSLVDPPPSDVRRAVATVTDVTESKSSRPVAPPAPPPVPVMVTRVARPELPQGSHTQRLLAKRLNRLYEALYARSPNGSPPPALLNSLLQYFQEAAGTETAMEADRVLTKVELWEQVFNQWVPLANAPVVTSPPPPAPSTPLPAPHAIPPGPRPMPRRTTAEEVKLADRLEQYDREFRRRTQGASDVSGLESQLWKFHERASQDLTANDRSNLIVEMYKWLEQLKAHYPL